MLHRVINALGKTVVLNIIGVNLKILSLYSQLKFDYSTFFCLVKRVRRFEKQKQKQA